MPNTTSRLALVQPVGTDAVSELRVSIADNAATLDAAVTWAEGVIAALPAASLAGRRYYATDLGQELYDTGSAWIPVGSAVPVGAVSAYAGSSDPVDADGTTRWMICDGRAISRSTYAHLFALVSSTYGAGDGSTTFNIPDLRGRTAIGVGSGSGLTTRTLASTGGEEVHQLVTGEMPQHNHGVNDPGHTHGVTDPGHIHTESNLGANVPVSSGNWEITKIPIGGGADAEAVVTDNVSVSQSTITAGASTGLSVNGSATGISTANAGGNGPHNNMQPFLAVGYIVKVL